MSSSTDQQKVAIASTQRVAFFSVLVLFALLHFFMSPLPFLVLGWFLEAEVVSHRIHETSFGLIFALSLVGLLAQLRRPENKIAAMYQVALPIWLTVAAVVLLDRATDPPIFIFLVAPMLLIALHPARRQLLRPHVGPSRVLAALAIVAAIPLVVFAVAEIRVGQEGSVLARRVFDRLPDSASETQITQALARATDSREALESAQHYGHWSGMGGFALSIVALTAIAALRVPGWRLPSWAAGGAAAGYGVASLFAPSDASAATGAWAILAIVWGIAFIGASEWQRRADRDSASPPSRETESISGS